jgi:hypothetical protein
MGVRCCWKKRTRKDAGPAPEDGFHDERGEVVGSVGEGLEGHSQGIGFAGERFKIVREPCKPYGVETVSRNSAVSENVGLHIAV